MDLLRGLVLSSSVKALRLLLLAVLVFCVSAGTPKPGESTHLKIIVGATATSG